MPSDVATLRLKQSKICMRMLKSFLITIARKELKMNFLIEFSVFGLFLVLDYIVGDKRAKELKEQNEKLWNMLENLSGVNKQVLQKYTVKLVEIMNENERG